MSKLIMDLSKIKDVPGCRGVYQAGNSFCALGKIIKSLDLPMPVQVDGMYIDAHETFGFIADVGRSLQDHEWTLKVSSLNDSKEGFFQENHSKALDMAIMSVLNSGLVELKNKELINV